MKRAEEILEFWFGEIGEDGFPVEDRSSFWFRSTPELDQQIKDEFETDVENAAAGLLDGWAQTAHGRLAVIILLDQFTRNIYRSTPQAFAYDHKALALTCEGIEVGHDLELQLTERAFMYLPLEHAEAMEHQDACVAVYDKLLQSCPEEAAERLQGYYNAVIEHRAIIERFGRFPHRNKILGRESTPEELAYLEEGARNFGQG